MTDWSKTRRMTALGVRVLFADDVPDEAGEIFEGAGLEFDARTPVRLEFDVEQQVGWAVVRRDDCGLVADLDVHLPAAYSGELTPAVGGAVLEKARWDPPCPDGARFLLKRVRITEIGLVARRNTDKRVPPVRWAP